MSIVKNSKRVFSSKRNVVIVAGKRTPSVPLWEDFPTSPARSLESLQQKEHYLLQISHLRTLKRCILVTSSKLVADKLLPDRLHSAQA